MKNVSSNSIFGLVLGRITLTTLVFLGLIAGIIYIQIDQTLVLLRNRSLENTALDIASYLEKTEEGVVYLDMPSADRKFYADAGKVYQYVVRGPNHQILFTSPISFSDRYPEEIWDEEPFFEFYGPAGTHFLGTSLMYEYDGENYLIQVAQSESTAEAFSDTLTLNFLQRTALYSLPFVLVLIIVIYFSLKQSLKPLIDVSRQARKITFQKPELRLEEGGLPQEILPLVTAINGALERLENGIKSQQEFTTNVAHELRTPLTILKTRVETLEDKAIAKEFSHDIEEMIHAVNQMLDLSKLDFPEAIGMENLSLNEVVKAVCQDMWPLFIRQERELKVFGIERKSTVYGNRDLIYRALRNLLDNTLVHTPPKTCVEVSIEGTHIYVRDHGLVILEADRSKIFQRFHRSDRQKFKLGAGLGLSIVGKTMKIHGGRVVLDTPSKGKGNVFRLEFPEV